MERGVPMTSHTRADPAAHGQPWWQTAVVYQVYTRSFMDSNGDGVGDIQGIIDRLDILNDGTDASLGVDALWLTPIYPSPQEDFGYDVSDYTGIDALFGDLPTFDRLLREAHERGVRVIMDLVLNHSSEQHPWFRESRSSRNNPRRDWYIWSKGRKGRPPNNWVSVFGDSAWTLDENTGEYYLHSFLKEQPDLNWRNPRLRAAVFDVMRFWLDRGVDGFRLDVYNCYFKDQQLRDNPHRASGLGLFYRYMGQRHVYDRDRPELLDVLREMRQLVDSHGERVLVGETLDETGTYKNAADYYGPRLDALHLAFNFQLLRAPWKPSRIRQAILDWYAALPEGAWPTWVMSNHDFPRHLSRYTGPGDAVARAKVAAALLLTLKGTPFLYYGEEIGMTESRIPRRQLRDPVGRRFWPVHKGRDGCRTPMQWDESSNAGFSPVKPWLPVNPDYRNTNLEAQRQDPQSLWNTYRRLIWLRKRTPALRYGDFEILDLDQPSVLAYRRRIPIRGPASDSPGSEYAANQLHEVTVICNLSHQVQTVKYTGSQPYTLLFSTHRDAGGPLRPGLVWLFPFEVILAGR